MKNYSVLITLLLMGLAATFVQGQSNFQFFIQSQLYPDGSTIYLSCTGQLEFISTRYERNSTFFDMTVKPIDVTSSPAGYSYSANGDFQLRTTKSNPQSGTFSIVSRDPLNGNYAHTFTVYFVTTPIVSFVPPLPTLGVNQSGTLQVAINQSVNSYGSISYTTDHGLRVNGGFSFSSGNTGNTNSVTLSDPSFGGNVYVYATGTCGNSQQIIGFFGTPYIAQQYFNGVPSGSNITTSSSSGDCSVSTDYHATNATWTQVGGSGSYSVNPGNHFIFVQSFLPITFG